MKISPSDTLPKTSIVYKVAYTPFILLVVVSTKESVAFESNTVDRDALDFILASSAWKLCQHFKFLKDVGVCKMFFSRLVSTNAQILRFHPNGPARQNMRLAVSASSVVLLIGK